MFLYKQPIKVKECLGYGRRDQLSKRLNDGVVDGVKSTNTNSNNGNSVPWLSRDRAARVVTVAFNIVARRKWRRPRRVAEFGRLLSPARLTRTVNRN